MSGLLERHSKLSPESKSSLNFLLVQLYEVFKSDESGPTWVHKPLKVLTPKGKQCVSSVISSERGQITAVLVAFSGSGI